MASASPPSKMARVNPPVPGKPMFGCGSSLASTFTNTCLTSGLTTRDAIASPLLEHLERLLSSSQENLNQSIGHYKLMLRKIFDTPAGPLQATKNAGGGGGVYALTSNYLCLQCPVLVTEEDRIKHGSKKAHRFCMRKQGHASNSVP